MIDDRNTEAGKLLGYKAKLNYRWFITVLSSVEDPGSGAFLTPEYGMYIPDHISESSETIFWVKILKFFDLDPESFWSWIWDLEWKNSDPG
jgi:hypothetical protein